MGRMVKIVIIFVTSCIILVNSYPTQTGPVPLTPEQIHRLNTWTEDDKQNIWELSGQFEGDIVLDDTNERNGLIDPKYRWVNNEIPYEIDSVFSKEQKDWINKSLDIYNQKTCIKVRPRNANDKNYIYITGENTGCHSQIGCRGGRQTLNLQLNTPGSGCLRAGTIQHEFLHALGFYHQQSATNRDDYVDIVWKNIQNGKEHNFDKRSEKDITDFGVAYDYGSILHYSEYAFSVNGAKTIVPKKSGVEIGQRVGLSASDITKLHKMYNCKTN